MTKDNITPHFTKEEVTCKCGCGFNKISKKLMVTIEQLRNLVNRPMYFSSACRCKNHNKKVGGSLDSAHLKGLAVDILINNSYERYEILDYLFPMRNIVRIGIAKKFIHVDIDNSKPQEICWLYKS